MKKQTGVNYRDGQPIFVGDVVETVQGGVFDVIELESLDENRNIKTTFALKWREDGKPYALEPYMSENLWKHENQEQVDYHSDITIKLESDE